MVPATRQDAADQLLLELQALDGRDLIARALSDGRLGRVALVSSFGAEAAVLLHLAATVDPTVPVILIDTRKLFGETLRYARLLQERLGLTDLRIQTPDAEALKAADPLGDLWQQSVDACCGVRKVATLAAALEGFDTWISGRKRFQAQTRADVPTAEVVDGRIKLNPLAAWSKHQLDAYFAEHDLPRHPLEADGFLSIGCFTCTDRVAPGEDARSGRWRGKDKTECGIHLPAGVGGRPPAR